MFHYSKVISMNLLRLHFLRISSEIQFHSANAPLLAGHSKWANIKHIKAQKDGEKAAQFTKLSRQIRLAVQEGGSTNPTRNTILRSVVEEALRKNMPMSTIQNNIKKSEQTKTELKKFSLELRYRQKVFAICVLYTDNLAAFKMEMAPIVKKAGAAFANVSHLFEEDGLIEATLDMNSLDGKCDINDRVTENAIECGAEDAEIVDESIGAVNFICRPFEMNMIRKAIESKRYNIQNAECIYTAKKFVQLSPDEKKPYELFLQKLRDLPGMEYIYDNVLYE